MPGDGLSYEKKVLQKRFEHSRAEVKIATF